MSSPLSLELEPLNEAEIYETMKTIIAELSERGINLSDRDYARLTSELKEVKLINQHDSFNDFLKQVVNKVIGTANRQRYPVGRLAGQVIGETFMQSNKLPVWPLTSAVRSSQAGSRSQAMRELAETYYTDYREPRSSVPANVYRTNPSRQLGSQSYHTPPYPTN